MNELKEQIKIENMIYEVRGKEVMLDSDLAKLYQITTGNLNKAVNRNIEKFPNDFMYRITLEEYKKLMFQNGISKIDYRKINKSLPRVFTEEGVAMLSSVLHTEIANKISINIMRAFVNMKKYISVNLVEQKYINNLVLEHDNRINLLEETFDKLSEKRKVNTIFYKGQIFDAYVVLMEILESSKESIIIIDDYAGYKLFDILKKIDRKILIITSNIEEVDFKKYEREYHNIKIKKSNLFHDRFIIIDKKVLYHSGSSFKDLGFKCFAINLINDENIINDILNMIGE